jgi:sugar-specific transcriptional regulator TrmB
MKFTALPFEKVLENLIEERRHRIHRLEQRKKELLKLWLSLPEPEDVKTRRETFQVLEGRRQISVKATEFLKECEGELLMAVPDNNLLWLYNSPFFDDLEKIERKRKLDVRILTNFSPTSTYVLEQINMDDKDFIYLDDETPGFIISDGGRMILLMDRSQDGGRKSLALWTNYESIVKAFRLLFTQLWEKEQVTSYMEMSEARHALGAVSRLSPTVLLCRCVQHTNRDIIKAKDYGRGYKKWLV